MSVGQRKSIMLLSVQLKPHCTFPSSSSVRLISQEQLCHHTPPPPHPTPPLPTCHLLLNQLLQALVIDLALLLVHREPSLKVALGSNLRVKSKRDRAKRLEVQRRCRECAFWSLLLSCFGSKRVLFVEGEEHVGVMSADSGAAAAAGKRSACPARL